MSCVESIEDSYGRYRYRLGGIKADKLALPLLRLFCLRMYAL